MPAFAFGPLDDEVTTEDATSDGSSAFSGMGTIPSPPEPAAAPVALSLPDPPGLFRLPPPLLDEPGWCVDFRLPEVVDIEQTDTIARNSCKPLFRSHSTMHYRLLVSAASAGTGTGARIARCIVGSSKLPDAEVNRKNE